ncbi:MAG: alpha/beta hydrolase [Hyphomicrobiaceae bacterium]|nr:alpha/beta hydrolase [Hyphomicrobiaceae bacterium]
MRVREIDILIVPGWSGSGPDHWQSRWERQLSTARRIEQVERNEPRCDDWVAGIAAAVATASRPPVIVAHGFGVIATVAAATRIADRLAGAFLVAPADPEGGGVCPAIGGGFSPVPMQALPFPTKLVGSSTDPYCSVERAQAMGAAWGADVSIIAGAGHINSESGHGPWPEGLLTFGLFLKRLGSLN